MHSRMIWLGPKVLGMQSLSYQLGAGQGTKVRSPFFGMYIAEAPQVHHVELQQRINFINDSWIKMLPRMTALKSLVYQIETL